MNHKLEFLRKTAFSKTLRDRREDGLPVELIVKTDFRKRDALIAQLEKLGKVTRVIDSLPYVAFRCDANDAHELGMAFSKLSESKAYSSITASISALDVSSRISIPAVQKKERASKKGELWNLEDIGAYAAKEVSEGSGASIAIIDTGVDYTHPEVMGRFGSNKGYDFVMNDNDPMDRNGHGTHVEGIAAGRTYGVASLASCYALRILDETGSGTEADLVAALDWAAKKEVDIVNMSLGSPYASTALEDMCYYLANKGTLLVAAAGNNGFGANYPAAFGDPVIAVAAVDEQNRHPDFSNIYDTNDISAPGVNITSSYLDKSTATLTGTSMAAPHISGSCAVAKSAMKKSFSLEEVLESTALKLGNGTFPERQVYGAGLVRVDRMVKAVMERKKASRYEYSKEILQIAGYAKEIYDVVKEVFT